jgi:hypothetical protein
MRYRSNRQYLHPVLRPDADDYGVDAALFATCDPPQYDQSDGMVSISVRFDLDEPTLTKAVRSSNATCAAMVYCGSTLYRDRLVALPNEPFIARGRIPVSRLKNEVQVHPVILATRDFTHSTDTAHPEYQGQSVSITRLAPLATDLPWFFDIDSDALPVRSIFRLEEDKSDGLNDGEFDVNIDIGQDYVAILANSDTLAAFNDVRKENDMPLPTVFTGAVLSVLAVVKEIGDDADDENCAWLSCVRAQLRSHNIDIERDTLFLAAQRLLKSPFRIVLADFVDADDSDE